MNFINALTALNNMTTTENGANAYKSTGNAVLDLFANGGGLRLGNNLNQVVDMFKAAYAQDKNLALKVIFYLRDVRKGQGEREIFRICMNFLAKNYPQDVTKLIKFIPEFGRWDDLYAFYGTSVFEDAMNLVSAQLVADEGSDFPSPCAKWLKSENTSSKASRQLARATAKALKLKISAYRKTLSRLRARADLLETKISQKNYSNIDYAKVPSQASLKYKKAFSRNDAVRYVRYLENVSEGKEKMNMGTVYPHQIVEPMLGAYRVPDNIKTLEAAWKSLPDYFEGKQEDMLVVADVSGSMQGEPLAVSVSLALYAAEHNQGDWNGKFMTFSEQPELVSVKGHTLFDKVRGISQAKWDMNTNVEAVFDLVLKSAIKSKSMVKRIVIVSDMEFDQASKQKDTKSLFDTMRKRYKKEGFEMPSVTFWNVRARADNFPAMKGPVQLVSGCSASTFKHIIAGTFPSPEEFMMSVIDSERYASIKVA